MCCQVPSILEESTVWRMILIAILFVFVLAGCGDDDGEKATPSDSAGGDSSPTASLDPDASPDSPSASTAIPPTYTSVPGPPREREEPEGDPYSFQAPFSVGNFVRQSLRGNVTSVQAGGQQVIYRHDDTTIVLTVYHFDQTPKATATVKDMLNAPTVVTQVGEIYESPVVTFGVVQDKHGTYLAAWNHYKWAFLVTGSGSLDALNVFLDDFPY